MASNTEIGTKDVSNQAPQSATAAVLMPSESLPAGSKEVHGIDFNKFRDREITVHDLVNGMTNMGFQASALGDAVRIINGMVGEPHKISH